MEALRSLYPRIVLDVELYRPKTGRRGRAGFFHSRLIAVGLAVEESPGRFSIEVLHDRDEARLVAKLFDRLEALVEGRRRALLAGYNILSLDLPVILAKAYEHHGVQGGRRAASLIYRRFLVYDMFQHALAEYQGEGLPSFNWLYKTLACRHGLPLPGKATGYSVHELYEEGRIGEILEYSRLDAVMHMVALAAILDGGEKARMILAEAGIGGDACKETVQGV